MLSHVRLLRNGLTATGYEVKQIEHFRQSPAIPRNPTDSDGQSAQKVNAKAGELIPRTWVDY